MSFGALSEEAKVALAKGAELARTGICSGEGGMLPEEQEACSRYFYELASARFGFSMDKLERVQAFVRSRLAEWRQRAVDTPDSPPRGTTPHTPANS